MSATTTNAPIAMKARQSIVLISYLCLFLSRIESSDSFAIAPGVDISSASHRSSSFCRNPPTALARAAAGVQQSSSNSWDVQHDDDNDDDDDDDDDIELDEDELDSQVEALLDYNEEEQQQDSPQNLSQLERAWRHASKPLLRIGSKGAHFTHGNSLRQLLEAHTAVKVKVNTRKYGTLEDAFVVLKELAEESGAPQGVELIQSRNVEKTILFGMPGTLDKIDRGEFPPPDKKWPPPSDEE